MHEHSVIAALAELECLEQERVDGERRRAAEHKLRAIERDVERRFAERLQRECNALEARLAGAHATREATLEQRIDELRTELTAANAARDTLREALTALSMAQPDVAPRSARMPWLGVAFVAIALGSIAVAYGMSLRAVPAHAAAAAVLPTTRTPEIATSRSTPPDVAPQAQIAKPPSAPLAIKPPAVVHRPAPAVHPARPRPEAPDPLGPIAGCGDDPMCGL